jgi:Uma2 family endonuclease
MNAPTVAAARFTDAEFERLVRSGALGDARIELRRGMLVNAQFRPHLRVKRLLARAIENALERAGLEWIRRSGGFGSVWRRLPALARHLRVGSCATRADGPIPASAVKLAVEVADSTLPDDVGDKLEDYAKAGLEEYWVADVQGRLILQHAGPALNTYAQREPRRFGESWSWLTRPDVVVDTSALLTQR